MTRGLHDVSYTGMFLHANTVLPHLPLDQSNRFQQAHVRLLIMSI
jgi:hypothetical protein